MKKLFLLAAAALTVFAACTKNEVVPTPDQKINFASPIVGTATKTAIPGEMNTTTKYFTNETFSVYALHHVGNYNVWSAGSVYMNNVDCAYSGTPGTYDDTQSWLPEKGDGGLAYYWPKDPTSYLTFAAYSPTDIKLNVEDGSSISYGATGLEVPNVTLPTADAAQYDFMYSERTYNKNANTGGTSYTGVNINFKHALSQIAFTVASNADYANDMTIKVQGITVQNVVNKGTFKENITDGTTYTAAPAWTLTTTSKYNHRVTMDETTVTDATSNYVNKNSIIIMPQPVNGLVAIVNYTIQHKASGSPVINQVATLPISETGATDDDSTTTVDESKTWMMGKKYVYNIIFGFDKIKFSPEVVDWTVVNNANLNI